MPIRRARSDDVPAIRRCVLDAYAVYAERLERPPAPVRADYGALVRAGHVFVDVAPELRGVLVVRARPDHLFVENVAVRPDAQRAGIGGRLLDFAERRARSLGLAELRLATHERMTENRAWYARRGWVETGRGTEDGYPRVRFAKPVAASRATGRRARRSGRPRARRMIK